MRRLAEMISDGNLHTTMVSTAFLKLQTEKNVKISIRFARIPIQKTNNASESLFNCGRRRRE